MGERVGPTVTIGITQVRSDVNGHNRVFRHAYLQLEPVRAQRAGRVVWDAHAGDGDGAMMRGTCAADRRQPPGRRR